MQSIDSIKCYLTVLQNEKGCPLCPWDTDDNHYDILDSDFTYTFLLDAYNLTFNMGALALIFVADACDVQSLNAQ